jgi:signal transduction histidine kinase/CheY-like chemotaxis protein/HPt (histidine-containing phosphotransfer) domain-containing protein
MSPHLIHRGSRYFNLVSLSGLGVVFLFSGLVIYGWFTDNRTLIQIMPHFAPMQFNTALCFMLSGVGGVAAFLRKPVLSAVMAGVIGAISGLTLLQYVTEFTLPIDRLFFDGSNITTKTSHAGRMSPATSVAFLLVALGLMPFRRFRLQLSCGFALIILSGLSFIGYVQFTEQLYGWGLLTRMAVHTMGSFFLLGLAMVMIAFRDMLKIRRFLFIGFWDVLPKILVVVMISLTTLFTYGVYELLQRENISYFQKMVTQSEAAIEKRLQLYALALRGGGGLMNASHSVERDEWQKYTKSLNIAHNLPGINGIGFIEPVAAKDLSAFLEKTAADGAPEFRHHPETEHETKFIIKFIEPVADNLNAVGLDIAFEANRREAAITSRDTGKMALTEPITLVQDETETAGFLLLMPVYQKNQPIETVQQRRAAFIGWVYAPFIGHKLLKDIAYVSEGQLNYSVYSGHDLSQEKLIYQHVEGASESLQQDGFSLSKSIIADERGLEWTIIWTPSALFKPPIRNGNMVVLAVLAAGLLISFMLVWVVQLLSRLYGGAVEELRYAKLKAEEASRAKSAFLANMSHEIRTPMNGILGTLDLISSTALNKKQREYVEVIFSSGRLLLGIINDILDLSKIESGHFTLSRGCVNVRKLVDNQLQLLRPLAEEKQLTLTCEWPEDEQIPEYFMGDEVRVKQVLSNLMGNAIKFTQSGTITLKPGYNQAQNRLKMTVADTGVGIAKDIQATIFDAFTQANHGMVAKAGGTGLGLAICKNLVEMMGGNIGFTSKPGQGSSFWFTLPYHAPSQEDMAKLEPTGNAQEVPRMEANFEATILVAEDNATNQFVIRELLEQIGCKVEIANNGEEAVEKVQAKPFDLVFMDCQMPVMDGYEATREIRKRGLFKLPVIALTANAISGDREKCLAAGMDDYLTKPASQQKLARILQENIKGLQGKITAASPAKDDAVAADMEEAIKSFGSAAPAFLKLTLQDSHKLMSEIEASIQASDSDGAWHAAHALKSVMRQVMAHQAADIAAKIEKLAKGGDVKSCVQEFSSLREAFDHAISQLQAIKASL